MSSLNALCGTRITPHTKLQQDIRRHPRIVSRATTRRAGHIRCAAVAAEKAAARKPVITLTDDALTHLVKLRQESGSAALLLRIGVKSGGCSGMSYHMDFEDEGNVDSADAVMEYDDGFRLVCDSKSLLYLFGMRLDWSSALIGGGFQFQNPNAVDSCGCGKSFGV